jgi:hypothetical protein
MNHFKKEAIINALILMLPIALILIAIIPLYFNKRNECGIFNSFSCEGKRLFLGEYKWTKIGSPTVINCGDVVVVDKNSSAILKNYRYNIKESIIEEIINRGEGKALDDEFISLKLYEETLCINKYDDEMFKGKDCKALITKIVGNIFISNDNALKNELSKYKFTMILKGKKASNRTGGFGTN